MSKIYGYCMEVSLKGMAEAKLKAQKDEILEVYPDAKIVVETVGTETYIRPLFNEMVESCKAGDMIVCTKLDRFCRSIKEGIGLLDELMKKGIKVQLLNMGTVDNSETGKIIYKNLCAFNEFQKAVKVDRMNSAKETYQTENHNIKVGRPKKFKEEKIEEAMKLLETYSYSEVVEMTGISKGTLWREKLKRSEM